MVSIPDWSRYRKGPPIVEPNEKLKQNITQRERYLIAMEKEAITEAHKKGYFLEPTKDEIILKFGETHGVEDPKTGLPLQKQMHHVNHIRFSHEHMKTLGDIGMFTRITILILDHNYLEDIEAIKSCKELVKLDIHSNQISILPDAAFWSQMQKLRILLAHDNPIGRVEVINSLVACSRLQILTLFDTPLSLKKNYRHHIVNTIWSLKALDHHVVSDEEIIEDAVFKNTRFTSLGRPFEIDLCPNYPKAGATFEDELTSIRKLIAEVNWKMSHLCPVMIIQKNIRLWLTYRRYKLYLDSRNWAATTIQRAWRKYKHLPSPSLSGPNLDRILPAEIQSKGKATNLLQDGKKVSESNLALGNLRRNKLVNQQDLVIDLQKLQKESLTRDNELNLPSIMAQVHMMAPKKNAGKVPGTRRIPTPPEPPGKRPIIHQSYYFGPILKQRDEDLSSYKHSVPEIVQTIPNSYLERTSAASGHAPHNLSDKVTEIPRIAFRLEGKPEHIRHMDKYEDNVLTRKEIGQDIRELKQNGHERMEMIPPPTRLKKDPKLKEKFLYERLQQTMALSCLTAVQQAYRDRDLDEKRAWKFQAVMKLRARRELAKERVKAYHEEKKLMGLASKQEIKRLIEASAEDKIQQLSSEKDKVQIKREKTKAHQKQSQNEYKFAVDFRMQQMSVSKALLKHDQLVHNDSKLQRKIENVESIKDMEKEQKEIVKKYLQHRQLMRQSLNATHRADLDSRMLQDANDKIFQAKSRVEQLKSRQEQARQYTSLPPTAMTVPFLQGSSNLMESRLPNTANSSQAINLC